MVDVRTDDSVRVHLDTFIGSHEDLYVAGIDGDNVEESMLRRGEIRAIEIKTSIGKAAVGLLGIDDDLDTRLVLEPLTEMPAVRGELGRG